jgi:hypothetical protein
MPQLDTFTAWDVYIIREIYTALLNPQPSSVPAITSTAPEESTWSARSAARTNDVDTDKR